MKKLFLGSFLLVGLLYGESINVKSGWQLIGADRDIDVTNFDDSKCMDYIWVYDQNKWKLHLITKEFISKNPFDDIDMIKKGEGFWAKINSDNCNINFSNSNKDNNSNNNHNSDVDNNTSCIPLIVDDTKFVDNPPQDIKWNGGTTVKEIEKIFNNARSQDSTISKELKLPPQSVWDKMSEQEKGLYLLNKERVDRGIKPYEGIDPNVITVAQKYAKFLYNNGKFEHEADGSPKDRLNRIEEIKNNQDFFRYSENLYVGAKSNEYKKEPIAQAIYNWIYNDSHVNYGHRNFCLATGLKDNSGKKGEEGLIGFGIAKGDNYKRNPYQGYKTTIVVMNGFDPNENYDLSKIKRVSLCTKYNEDNTTTVDNNNSNSENNTTQNKEEDNITVAGEFRVNHTKGVIEDTANKLLWQNKDLGQMGLLYGKITCNNLELADKNNWRMPTTQELQDFHKNTAQVGIEPKRTFKGCIVETSSEGKFVGTKAWKDRDPNKNKIGELVSFSGIAGIRCVSDETQDPNADTTPIQIKPEMIETLNVDSNASIYKNGSNSHTTYIDLKVNSKKEDLPDGLKIKLKLEPNAKVYKKFYREKEFSELGSVDSSGEFELTLPQEKMDNLNYFYFVDEAGNYSKILKIYDTYLK